MTAYIPMLVALLGLLLYIMASNGKVSQIGYALFCIGMFILVLGTGNKAVKLF